MAAVSFTVVADSMVASTVAADMAVDAGNPLQAQLANGRQHKAAGHFFSSQFPHPRLYPRPQFLLEWRSPSGRR
jgi:hypothetical protein